jgi:hypothetical protein
MNAQEKIKITTGTASFITTTNDNSTAKAFIDLLPMTISMSELNGNEKYHFLSNNLPSAPENPSIIHAGDLMLYGSNCIVLFYETFNTSYSYTKIGVIDNPSGLKSALGSGNPTVTFELINATGLNTSAINDIGFEITKDGILQVNENVKTVSLMDLNGRTILRTSSNTVNTNDLPKGIYLLLVESLQKTKTYKIII